VEAESARRAPGKKEVRRELHFEVAYPNPPKEVWRALTDPKELASWLMENNFAPRVGHKFQFQMKSRLGFSRAIECEVLEVDEPRTLSYRWGKDGSVVTFRLDPAAEGTTLHLEHKGFRGVRGRTLAWMLGRGWKRKIFERLPAILGRAGLRAKNLSEGDGK
jgi:uncharacterized protein YndB with AHSA1/START domain